MHEESPTLTLERAAPPGTEAVLSREARAFVAKLASRFSDRVRLVLEARTRAHSELDALASDPRLGDRSPLQFLASTADLRAAEWRVAEPPADLLDRRVEITGPVDRKMIINA